MRVLLAAVGNPLAGDDGAGPAVAAALARRALPPWVRVVDLHTDVLALSSVWRDEREVWLLDAMALGKPPGTVHRAGHEELLAMSREQGHVHALSVPGCLAWLRLAEPRFEGVRFRAWGIEPASVEPGESLSPSVAAAVRRVVREVAEELLRRDGDGTNGTPSPDSSDP